MSFKCRPFQSANVFFPFKTFEREQLDDGSQVFREVPMHKTINPDDFQLSAMLKAGIPLDKVDTRVLGSSSIDLPSSFGSEVSGEPSEVEKNVSNDKE